MTNEVLVTFTRQTLDTSYQDPSKLRLDALNVDFLGVFLDQSGRGGLSASSEVLDHHQVGSISDEPSVQDGSSVRRYREA